VFTTFRSGSLNTIVPVAASTGIIVRVKYST
jgi:hypothetical protein